MRVNHIKKHFPANPPLPRKQYSCLRCLSAPHTPFDTAAAVGLLSTDMMGCQPLLVGHLGGCVHLQLANTGYLRTSQGKDRYTFSFIEATIIPMRNTWMELHLSFP